MRDELTLTEGDTISSTFGLGSLKPPDVEVVMQKVWVCLPSEWEHQRR